MKSGLHRMLLRWLAAAVLVLAGLMPVRAEPVDVSFSAPRIDLLPQVEAVESYAPQATIELPAADGDQRQTISLTARGPGPLYRWAVFTLHNDEPMQRELIIAAPHQHFAGSGVVWPRPEGSRILGLATSQGTGVAPLHALGTDAFPVTLPPGATVSYVLEVSPAGLDSLMLWRRGAFHAVGGQYAFFRGMILGISSLLGVAIACLFIVSRQAVFPAVALFAWSAIAFLAIEAGYLPAVLAGLGDLGASGYRIRAIVEALMLTGVIAALVSLVELRRRMPSLGLIVAGLGVAAAALAVFAWFEPRIAAGVARIGFAAVVMGGLGIILVLRRRGVGRARAALLAWVVLTAWTIVAALGALDLVDTALIQPVISAGLMLVLLTMAFTVAQFAFSPRLTSGPFFEEASRRALALSASDQAVWDWQVDRGRLHVGAEIERALGLDEGSLDGWDLAPWLERVHPADRAAYAAAMAAVERRGRGSFSQEFRMRRADGGYRWFLLRGRAIPSGSAGAARLIGTLADVSSLRRSEDRLLADAVRDRVTGLPNRGLFLDRIERALHGARDGEDTDLHVIAVNLDRFKSLNEGLGHEAGDALLSTIGRRLAACVGPADTVARLSGGQFGILCDAERPPRDMLLFAARLADEVSQPVSVSGRDIVVTASVGIAPFHRERQSAEQFLKDAEIALYEAMQRGSGAVELFRPDMLDERSELLNLEQNLRRALERDEIEVVYQPIVRLSDRKLAGFEALMRWRRGATLIEPDSFLKLAEETGLIRELGHHVLSEAGRRLGMWQRAFRPHEPLYVAVNVSSSQLLNGNLVADVEAIMEREELRPGTLKLELTESVVMENPELAHTVLQRLTHMGVTLACDDFGTGYSAFESLLRLPFDTVKIAGSLLDAPAEGDRRRWIVVDAIVRLARKLELAVVAEGIETEDQMQRLEQLGCDYGQGYLVGSPVTAQQVVAALGGMPYGASDSSGLAAVWSRFSRRSDAKAVAADAAPWAAAVQRSAPEQPALDESAPEPEGAPWPVADEPEPVAGEAVADESAADELVLDLRAVIDTRPDEGLEAEAPAAEAADDEGEAVLDIRAVMPAAGSAPPPALPPTPAVGSVPFAPRLAGTADPGPPQHEDTHGPETSTGPQIEVAEPVEPEPVEPEPAEPEPEPAEPEPEPAAGAGAWPVIHLAAADVEALAAPAACEQEKQQCPPDEPALNGAGHNQEAAPGKRRTAKGARTAAAKSLRKRVRRSRRGAAKQP